MDINQVVIFGRLGKDPELRQTPGGDSIVSFAIANSTWKKNKATGEWDEDTSWFDCSLFGDAAKRFVERSKKGDRVIVTGSLKQRKWKDKDDNWQERITVQVRGVQFLEKKPQSAATTEQPAQTVQRDEVPF